MNIAIKDFLGLFKQYDKFISPEVMKHISKALPKIHQLKTLEDAVHSTIGYIPQHLRTPKVIKVIERMGRESQAQQTFRQTGKYVLPAVAKGMKGAATIGALGTIGAGAAATAAMAYPMHRLGRELGYRIEEKKATKQPTRAILQKEAPETLIEPKREQFNNEKSYRKSLEKFRTLGHWATPAPHRLREEKMPFREYAPYLPGVQAMKRLYETPYRRFGGDVMSLKESTAKMKKEIQTPLKIGPSPRLKDFFSRAYGKIKSIRFKEAK